MLIRRYADIEFRNEETDSRVIEGVACVFNQRTTIGDWFTEEIDQNAFDNCDMSDVVLNFNHDDSYLLAGTRNGTLQLGIDDFGLKQRSSIIDTIQGNDVLKLVRSGLLNKMSFAFEIDEGGEEWSWQSGEELEHRKITRIKKLYDVSLVTFPAYEGTAAFARSGDMVDSLALQHRKEREKMEEKDVVIEEKDEIEEQEEVVETAEEEREEEKEVEKKGTEKLGLDESLSSENVEKRSVVKSKSKRDSKENIAEWRNAIMTGMENRAGLISTGTGIPVPTLFQSFVETAWSRIDILDEVTKSYIKGIFKVPYEVSADGANYHVEGSAAPNEENLTLGVTTLTPVMIKKWISVTDELLALTDEEFMRYVADEVVYQVAKFLQNAIIAGNGQGSGSLDGVVGITNAALTEELSTALGFNAGNEALAVIDGGENPLMVVNKKTFFKNIMGLTDLQGRPIYQILTDNAGRPQYYVNGIRVKFSDALKDYDTATSGDVWAVVGDFRAYRLNLPEGENVQTLYDPYTLATEDKSRMLGRIFAAGNVVKPERLAKLTKPAA